MFKVFEFIIIQATKKGINSWLPAISAKKPYNIVPLADNNIYNRNHNYVTYKSLTIWHFVGVLYLQELSYDRTLP